MPRDRLQELQAASKYRQETQEDEGNQVEMTLLDKRNKGAKKEEESKNSMEDFLEKMEEIVFKVDKVEKNTLELRSVQRKILNSTHKDEQLESRMEDLMAENKKLAVRIRKIMKEEQEWVSENDIDPKSSPKKKISSEKLSELRLRKTQVAAQSRRFYNVWNEYNSNQIEFRDKSKNMMVKWCKITNSDFTDDQIEKMLDEGNTAMFAKSILDEEKLARQQLTELQDRHDEFIKLEKSLREVHDMFVDLADLVQQQGEMIDNIEANVASASADVERGKSHLGQAREKMIAARKKKLCLVVCLSSVLVIVLLVILNETGILGLFSSGGGEPSERIIIQAATEPSTSTTTSTTSSSSTTTTTLAP